MLHPLISSLSCSTNAETSWRPRDRPIGRIRQARSARTCLGDPHRPFRRELTLWRRGGIRCVAWRCEPARASPIAYALVSLQCFVGCPRRIDVVVNWLDVRSESIYLVSLTRYRSFPSGTRCRAAIVRGWRCRSMEDVPKPGVISSVFPAAGYLLG